MPKTFENPPVKGLPLLSSKPKAFPGRDDLRKPKATPGKAPVMKLKQMPGKGGHR